MKSSQDDPPDRKGLLGIKVKKAAYAARRARERAKIARWNMDIVIFLFAIFITIVILLFQGFSTEIVAPIAIFGLAAVWLIGRRQGKQLYELFLKEELSKYEEYDDIDFAGIEE